ncbi:hypothetical protein TBR22_A40890 [Luteitalea sp. TBR-22]|uniref:sensor histidine kinase n=1 Tax=Luteitalea sp. TBR-22 TaxID=2802971 RepID=UPI001AF121B6|nr:sensor histidine kinase [Luteitalea sp. TBR-22]BCS34863.1 hypothetical protein TBR22_A40890 [Luteitalea sp. TBR-22]
MTTPAAFFSPRRVLRGLTTGFALVVLLLVAAVYVGYQGSRSIHDDARELVREHLLTSGRGAELERSIEQRSKSLLDDLEMVLGLCLVIAMTSAAAAIWTTQRAFQRLEWHAAELSRVSWHMLQDQEMTARRFSHEMHDELGQTLTGLRGMLKQLSPEAFEARRQECVGILDEALTGVRELSQLLRPVILDDFGLDAGLRWLVHRFAERTGILVRYESNFEGRLVEEDETHLFRIAQEALTNVARHARATEADVRLRVSDDVVTLTIADNGRGLPIAIRKPSLGMVGMRARARHIGGEFEVTARPEGGLLLSVSAPARPVVPEDNDQEDTNPAG